MTDKSREQFEKYFIEYYLNDNPELVELFLKRDGEGYKLPSPNDEWRVWQASRKAMEIELPVPTYSRPDIQAAAIHMVGLCKNVLRAIGLKIKGE